MGKGCLWPLAAILFSGLWFLGLILFIAFGPRSILLGMMFGIGYISLTAGMLRRFPQLTEAFARGQAERRFRQTGSMDRTEHAPDSIAGRIEHYVGWALTAAVATIALMLGVMAWGLWLKGTRDSGLTGAATLSGMAIAGTYYFWKHIPHSGRVR